LRDNRWSALRCPIVGSIPARLQNSLCFSTFRCWRFTTRS